MFVACWSRHQQDNWVISLARFLLNFEVRKAHESACRFSSNVRFTSCTNRWVIALNDGIIPNFCARRLLDSRKYSIANHALAQLMMIHVCECSAVSRQGAARVCIRLIRFKILCSRRFLLIWYSISSDVSKNDVPQYSTEVAETCRLIYRHQFRFNILYGTIIMNVRTAMATRDGVCSGRNYEPHNMQLFTACDDAKGRK